ncbi:subtilisin-like protease [Capsicum galapagoense]
MASSRLVLFSTLVSLFSFYLRSTLGEQKKLQTYIIHVSLPTSEVNLESYYRSFLPVEEDQTSSSRLVHSYHHVISGFAAKLAHGELKEMEKKDGFITAKPQKMLALQTTHTLNFLGLQQNSGVWQESNYGRGVIIGLLDSGITPDHPSFHDNNMPPPPEKWKGKCEFTDNVTCNNKLLGARNLLGGGSSDPPFDDSGHGTHTSSTAAGNFVDHANIFGNANGTSAGMAPLAHIAMYKVCSGPGITCAEVDMLAAIEASIHDGVDVLSISIGGLYKNFYDDYLAVGAFAAMRNGIIVVASAGNKGPGSGTLSNEAPWILTVGASSHDRKIVATAVLGNGESYHGQTLFQGKDFPPTLFPLAYSREIAKCEPILLKNADVRGKIVVCDYGMEGPIYHDQAVKDAGGISMILVNANVSGDTIFEISHVLPAAILSFADGEKIKAYITSSSTARAGIIFEGTMMGFKDVPSVAYFSSRGPNNASPGILKPDIIGPELNILAAWPSSLRNINSTFNIISGTSMSCPHLSGTAALLKIAHSDWSPAAIKSVVMTTADQFSREGQPILDERELRADVFAIGAGHVNPTKAITPGLIYDIHPMNYSRYLCGLGYTNIQIGLLVSQKMNCSLISSISEAELNYPSFSILLGEETRKYSRIVTNVGDGNSTYVASIAQIPGVHTVVEPMELVFTKVNQQATYMISFT